MNQTDLKGLLRYNARTGIFIWRVRRAGIPAGTQAGRIMKKRGYRQIRVYNKQYLAHRLAWLWVFGVWPAGNLDHKDRVPDNNRIKNLRVATAAQNAQNRRHDKRNKSGHRGVIWHKRAKKWQASIGFQGRLIHLGQFASITKASASYEAKAKELHGEFSGGRS